MKLRITLSFVLNAEKNYNQEVIDLNDTKNRTTIMIIFAIVVIATVFLFFIITSKIEAVDWIGVMFILIAEVSFFCGLISIENHSSALMLRSGIYSVISIYSLTAIIVSVIFMLWFRESIITFISLQVAIIAITLILVVMFISFSMSAAKKNKEVLNQPSSFSLCTIR